MKSLVVLLTASLLFSANTVFAAANIFCERGEFGQNNHLSVEISSTTVVVALTESSYTIKRDKVNFNGNSFSILNQMAKFMTEEGTPYPQKVDMLMVYQPKAKKMNVTLLIDGEGDKVESIRCR